MSFFSSTSIFSSESASFFTSPFSLSVEFSSSLLSVEVASFLTFSAETKPRLKPDVNNSVESSHSQFKTYRHDRNLEDSAVIMRKSVGFANFRGQKIMSSQQSMQFYSLSYKHHGQLLPRIFHGVAH